MGIDYAWKEAWIDVFGEGKRKDITGAFGIHIHGFGGTIRGNYLRIGIVGKTEMEVREKTLKNGKIACKDEVGKIHAGMLADSLHSDKLMMSKDILDQGRDMCEWNLYSEATKVKIIQEKAECM